MSLKDQISEEIKAAMKAKDKVRLEAVRGIKKVLLEKESEVKGKGQEALTPEQELEVLMQQAKQRRDSIEQYTQAGREDMAESEKAELTVIEEFLPQQLSEDEIAAVIDEVIAEVKASSPKDMGKVMGPAMQRLKGQADGKKVQELVKTKLSS
ncbi:MAG: GatB/YqeY domain-containing protein [Cyanobacteriota bacterium]|nr:GatB/YqeY domain-containing protein [Cyanobacteriota bacterium]